MNKTLELWKIIAEHYKEEATIAGYDILNSPIRNTPTMNKTHLDFYDKIYKTIRSVDNDHIIIMQSCWNPNDVPSPSTSDYGWENSIYEYHIFSLEYTDNTGTTLTKQKTKINDLISKVQKAKLSIPYFVGNFSLFSNIKGWEYSLNLFSNSGYCFITYNYKAKTKTYWGLFHERNTSSKVDLLNNTSTIIIEEIKESWSIENIGTNFDDRTTYYDFKYFFGKVKFANKLLNENDYFSIKAVNNNMYFTDNWRNSPFFTAAINQSLFESFIVVDNLDGTVSFQCVVNSNYLSIDWNIKNYPIYPLNNTIGPNEKCFIEQNNDNTYSLRTFVNNKYLISNLNDKLIVNENRRQREFFS